MTPTKPAPPSDANERGDAPTNASAPRAAATTTPPADASVPPLRALAGGFLMGLANLVPGVSGGTMILALGLYDRFIGAIADVTRLRWRVSAFVFLGILGVGLAVAILGGSGVAVALVTNHRWIMYSLFIGLTLGGVPELVRLARPFTPGTLLAIAVGLGLMVALFLSLSEAAVPENFATLGGVGALAASSMILPGISGSYILLIFGLYDRVIGSLSVSALREDPLGCLSVVGPVVLGSALGIALLSNVLRVCLARYRGPSHGLLLGLLLGSVVGLWPFQEPVHPELANKPSRKAIAMLVEGASFEEASAKYAPRFTAVEAEAWRSTYAGATKGELKRKGETLRRFEPSAKSVASALGLIVVGFLLTQALSFRGKGRAA